MTPVAGLWNTRNLHEVQQAIRGDSLLDHVLFWTYITSLRLLLARGAVPKLSVANLQVPLLAPEILTL